MTTIAYRDGVLAADTLSTCEQGIMSFHTTKIGAKAGVVWSTSGLSAWGKRFRDWMTTGMKGDYPTPDDTSGACVWMPNGDMLSFGHNGIDFRPRLPFWADGSGQDYAIGAMQMGASAEEAVRAAMVWDHKTGGDVVVVRQ